LCHFFDIGFYFLLDEMKQTFMRQKVTLACPASSDQAKEETKAQSAKIGPSATLGSERSEHLKCAGKYSESSEPVSIVNVHVIAGVHTC